jgi:uncharacterized protein with PIN domain
MLPRFFCDAMLGGLSRWLRAAGYDAAFEYGIDDAVLVRRAGEEGRIVLSSDGGIFARTIVKNGNVPALHVPRATPSTEQLVFVLRAYGLGTAEPRCMACGGELREVPKTDVAQVAPPRSFAAYEQFWTCVSCTKLYWHGTHWAKIARTLEDARSALSA